MFRAVRIHGATSASPVALGARTSGVALGHIPRLRGNRAEELALARSPDRSRTWRCCGQVAHAGPTTGAFAVPGLAENGERDAAEPTCAGQPNGLAGEAAAEVLPPSKAQLRMLGLASALPFVGFGFLDNFLMIVSGEFIDSTLCVAFSFSTMAAAAIGNTISDCAGIFCGGAVEELASRCGVEEPPMSRAQQQMWSTRVWQYGGQVVGIVIGCTLGCCPLLFMDHAKAERLKHEKEQQAVFQSMVEKVAQMLHADAAALMLVDRERGDLYSNNVTQSIRHFRWRKEDGFMGHAATTGKFVNVADVREDSHYDPLLHDDFLGSGIKVQSLLCMPVWHKGEVVGLINVINKKEGTFTTRDEDVLSAISTHVAVAMSSERDNFEEVLDNCERCVAQQGAPQWSQTTQQRRKTLIEPVLQGMRSVLNSESIALLLFDEEQQQLYTEAVDGSLPSCAMSLGDSYAGWTVERGVVLNTTLGGPTDPGRSHHPAYDGVDIRSVLCVPIFDTRRKCLGAFEVVNKRSDEAFTADDVKYAQQVASYIAMMLEGPTAELRRVLALTRQKMQHQDLVRSGTSTDTTVICFCEQAHDLPESLAEGDGLMDPYITMQVVRGDPLQNQAPDLKRKVLAARSRAATSFHREISKTATELVTRHPKWDETVAVPVPESLEDVLAEELYLHVLLWDYDSLHEDQLVAQNAFPLAQMPHKATRGARPFPLYPIPGQEGWYKLEKTRIWLSLSRGATL